MVAVTTSSSLSTGILQLHDTAILTADMVEYDFEKFALQHGIPETIDPLPYRKTGSVFSSDDIYTSQQQQSMVPSSSTTDIMKFDVVLVYHPEKM